MSQRSSKERTLRVCFICLSVTFCNRKIAHIKFAESVFARRTRDTANDLSTLRNFGLANMSLIDWELCCPIELIETAGR
eukprot:scaffold37387_cov51-Prasinocladus_malaysianus.AAC.1